MTKMTAIKNPWQPQLAAQRLALYKKQSGHSSPNRVWNQQGVPSSPHFFCPGWGGGNCSARGGKNSTREWGQKLRLTQVVVKNSLYLDGLIEWRLANPYVAENQAIKQESQTQSYSTWEHRRRAIPIRSWWGEASSSSQNTVESPVLGTIFHDIAIGISYQNDDDQLDDETTEIQEQFSPILRVRIPKWGVIDKVINYKGSWSLK